MLLERRGWNSLSLHWTWRPQDQVSWIDRGNQSQNYCTEPRWREA